LQNAEAEGDTRTLSFHHIHTKEDLTVTYKVNGRYDEEALKKINWVMRDWRKNESTKMDPHTIDILWDVHRATGATEAIWIICGYRSPATNSMLRSRSGGVAKFSQHMQGKAVDFYIPGVPLERLREAGLRAQRGGVGFYPSSNFVHMDTGSVRHWPRVPEAQMARVMAKGPLPTGRSDRTTQVAALPNPMQPISTLLGAFRTKENEQAPKAATVAAVEAKPEKPVVTAAAVPLPRMKPVIKAASFEVASAESRPVQLPPARSATLASSTPSNSIIEQRGFWQAQPEADAVQAKFASRASQSSKRATGTEVASADPSVTGSLAPWPLAERIERAAAPEGVLAYAPATAPVPAPVAPSATKAVATAPPDTTVAVKRSGNRPSLVSDSLAAVAEVKPGTRFNEPWLRAMIVSPSVQDFMSTAQLGTPDYRNLGPYLQKPSAAVMITFADDPHLGLSPATFSGSAVVFVSTVTFNQRTASLR